MSVGAMKAGAIEFLQKPFRDQELLDAIQQALDRSREARQTRAELSELQERFASLTRRETEVMRFVVTGLLNKKIAHELGITETTVKIHRGQVMNKMGAGSVAELVRIADRGVNSPPVPTRVGSNHEGGGVGGPEWHAVAQIRRRSTPAHGTTADPAMRCTRDLLVLPDRQLAEDARVDIEIASELSADILRNQPGGVVEC
jgi:DNA-binding CsgD family transcriptional regulator